MKIKATLSDVCQKSYASWGIAYWPKGSLKNGRRELVINLGIKEYTLWYEK